MMSSLGHEVFLYAGTETEANVTELITVVSDEDRQKWFGHYDWNTMVFNEWDRHAECWRVMNDRAAEAIGWRQKPGDFLCLIAGLCQEDLKKKVPGMTPVEWGIGYEGILQDAFHVFESYAWMHYVYGKTGIIDGRFFDTVIPNSFDEDDFSFESDKDDYLLYLGRMTPRKGMIIVEELAKLGHRIISAGQGDYRIPGVEHRGVVRGDVKKKLLAEARAVVVPTIYIEPFGGVAVEAMLSGTPVITTDFGAFTETVKDGVTGYRCSTLAEFHRAAGSVQGLDPFQIGFLANKYLTKLVRHSYQNYFERLSLLSGKGWYTV